MRGARLILASGVLLATTLGAHFGIRAASRIAAPEVQIPELHVMGSGGVRRAGRPQ